MLSTFARVMGRYPVVRQHDEADCGPAALASVLQYWGGSISLLDLKLAVGTDATGSSLSALRDAAVALGFDANGASGTWDDLATVDLPCIAHVVRDGRSHFVVVYRLSRRRLTIGDPARGLLTMSHDEFRAQWKGIVLVLQPTARVVRSQRPHWLALLWPYVHNHEVWLHQVVFLGLVYTGLGILAALFIQVVVDRLIPSGDVTQLLLAGSALLVLHGLRSTTNYLRQRFLYRVAARTGIEMTSGVVRHLYALPSAFFNSRMVGEVSVRLRDLNIVQGALLQAAGNAVTDLVLVVGTIGALLVIAPALGWIALTALLGYCMLVSRVIRRVRREKHDVLVTHGRLESSLVECVTGIEDIRSYRAGPVFAGRTAQHAEAYFDRAERLGLTQAGAVSMIEMASAVFVLLVLLTGAASVMGGSLRLGAMLGAYALVGGALMSISRLADTTMDLAAAGVAGTRLSELLGAAVEPSDGIPVPSIRVGLALQDAVFGWGRGPRVLARTTLAVPLGRMTGVWGSNGSGKSTIARLLDRRHTLESGTLRLDGADVSGFALDEYRRQVVVVSERAAVFQGSLADNILMGRDMAHDALAAHVHRLGFAPFFARFPNGFATVLGHGGRQLSSGENQLLGLCRALLDEPAVLIVDEGTNAVDVTASVLIGSILRDYASTHAVLVISHDVPTLMRCDYLYLLGEGQVQEEGAPAELARGAGQWNALLQRTAPWTITPAAPSFEISHSYAT